MSSSPTLSLLLSPLLLLLLVLLCMSKSSAQYDFPENLRAGSIKDTPPVQPLVKVDIDRKVTEEEKLVPSYDYTVMRCRLCKDVYKGFLTGMELMASEGGPTAGYPALVGYEEVRDLTKLGVVPFSFADGEYDFAVLKSAARRFLADFESDLRPALLQEPPLPLQEFCVDKVQVCSLFEFIKMTTGRDYQEAKDDL
eukprot:TRINITY_DN893_c2_g2_i1.p1 TRINITY_DN893_c2_g2~~TRINITY_DN893_c2_g2_i1.p1  ORF type:complete len:211 (-),score=42.19 TRINITY_DN893_c2_g2_i1:52-639(-)